MVWFSCRLDVAFDDTLQWSNPISFFINSGRSGEDPLGLVVICVLVSFDLSSFFDFAIFLWFCCFIVFFCI